MDARNVLGIVDANAIKLMSITSEKFALLSGLSRIRANTLESTRKGGPKNILFAKESDGRSISLDKALIMETQ